MLRYFCVVNVPEFQYCFWLFTDVDYFSCANCSHHFRLMFMWFSCTETYWWSVHTSSSFVIDWCWHIFVWKMFQNFNIVFDYLLILTIFHVQNVLIIFNWCLCDFLVLKHIDEVYTLHLHLSLTDVDIFLCCKCSRISILFLIIYWFWLFFMCKMFLSFSTDVYVIFLYWNILMKCMHFIFICHLLMLTYFCVENILEFQYCFWYWCWLFFMCKMFYHFQLMFMWFSCTETYWWSAHTSSSFVIDWCWHFFVENMFQNFNIVFDSLLILTIFHVQNVLIIFNWCLCDFLVLKHIDEVYTLHLHLSFTDVDIFLCQKCSRISILFLIIYWYWLFFMCKMFLSFSTDVYVIFLYWNILMKCTHFIFICHWLMLTYFLSKMFQNFNIVFDSLLILTIFHVQNVLIIFNWCLCDFLVLKHIDEVHTLHLHLSLTCVKNVDFNIVFDSLLILTIFHVQNVLIIFNWFLLKHIHEVL